MITHSVDKKIAGILILGCRSQRQIGLDLSLPFKSRDIVAYLDNYRTGLTAPRRLRMDELCNAPTNACHFCTLKLGRNDLEGLDLSARHLRDQTNEAE